MLISQDFFDETLVESQELFEYSDDQAVQETISELKSGNANVRLDHLSLTHPESEEGRRERDDQKAFVQALEKGQLYNVVESLGNADKKSLVMYASLVLQKGFLAPDAKLYQLFDKKEGDVELIISFFLALLPDVAMSHPLTRDLKLALSEPLRKHWFPLYQQYRNLQIPLLRWAIVCCNACEGNKKTFVQAAVSFKGNNGQNGLEFFLESLPEDIHSGSDETNTDRQRQQQLVAKEMCKLISILGKFQASSEPQPEDGQPPLVSSAHANVKEWHKCGAVNRLHLLAKQSLELEELLCECLSALRVMAIDNDIVQNMVAVGILETVHASLLSNEHTSAPLSAATLGLIRNLCANDEIKTNVCKKSLPAILHHMETHASNALVQEHGCGILGAMALRQPHNAVAICDANGAHHILTAMRAFPQKVPLQRQGCLALRNMAVRFSTEQKQVLLDAGAENVLKLVASQHQGSIDEAYAALRDLGCAPVMYTMDKNGKAQGTQVFGQVKSNFRAVYD